ncbi:MAG: MFS transporter [Treponema sp.]|jgi:HEAT repeat protein|nr:MFS transporter [Treponema sp.]
MDSSALSPYRLGKARDLYNTFNVFNSLSWQFLVGNIITLFALKLKASSTYIGTLNAILYCSLFFLPFGKLLAKRFSIIKIYSNAWILRAVGMIPAIIAPFAAYGGREDLALVLVIAGVSVFHVSRGIGMIGNNPVLSFLSTGPDRGSYMSQIQIINNAVGMFGGFIIAMLLGRDPPLFLYSVIFIFGLGTGIASGLIIRKIPGPPIAEDSGPPAKLPDLVRQAWANPSLKQFILILFLVALISGVSRAFLVVYSREIFAQTDGMISLYAVFAGLGVLMIGLMVRFLVDRIGAKPIFIICVIIGFVSLIPILFVPGNLSETTVVLYLTFLFFMINFGFLGAEGIAQTYFLSLIPSGKMLDMGILYFFVFGIAGTSGSFLAGVFLDAVTGMGFSYSAAFRILYLIMILLSGTALALQRKLVPLGAIPFKGALEVLFSFRDLRAISLLDRLDKTVDTHEEAALLGALHDTPSKLAIKGLLDRVKSPRLPIRLEALRAIGALETLDENTEKALKDDIINNSFTTAYYSARILGKHKVFSAIPLLRNMASSKDYMLAGEAVIALAKLGDNAFRPTIEKLIAKTKNPRLKIMGVEAAGFFGSPNSLSVLLEILKGADPPPYLRDEVILAMANILNIHAQFYPLLVRFLTDESLVSTLALDEAEAAYEHYVSVHGRRRIKKEPKLAVLNRQAKELQPAVFDFIRNAKGAQISGWIQAIPSNHIHTIVQSVLSEAVLDDELIDHLRLRLLVVTWCANELRFWTNKAKEERG